MSDLAAMKRRHRLYSKKPDVCITCALPWPCDAARLIEELEQAEARNAALLEDAQKWRWIHERWPELDVVEVEKAVGENVDAAALIESAEAKCDCRSHLEGRDE